MIDEISLHRATLIGTALQVAMVVTGHFVSFVADDLFMMGGMTISAVAGYLYVMNYAAGYLPSALGGAIAGGVCALVGIALSALLGDTALFVLAAGTASSALAGALGGLIGQKIAGAAHKA